MLAQLELSLATFKIKQMLSAPSEEFLSLELNLSLSADPRSFVWLSGPSTDSLSPPPPTQSQLKRIFFKKVLPAFQFEGLFEVLVH